MFEFHLIELMTLTINMSLTMAILLIAMRMIHAFREYSEQNKIKKIERTLEVLLLPEQISKTIYRVLSEKSIDDYFHNNPFDLFSALSYFENIATGIRTDVYDENLVFDRLGDTLPRFYFLVANNIYVLRSKGFAPSFYLHLERLSREWKERSPRKMESYKWIMLHLRK